MMTLDEMLALLPDNTTGDISAADMRAIVTDLYGVSSSFAQVFSFQWVFGPPDAPPTSGEANVGPAWGSADTLYLSITALDGHMLSFGVIDRAAAVEVWVVNAEGSRLVGHTTGPSVDLGEYRTIPMVMDSLTGPEPEDGTPVTVALWVTL